jgi:hypothetical protein
MKGATCPHCLEDTCAVWPRIQRNTYLWGTVVSSARNINTGP